MRHQSSFHVCIAALLLFPMIAVGQRVEKLRYTQDNQTIGDDEGVFEYEVTAPVAPVPDVPLGIRRVSSKASSYEQKLEALADVWRDADSESDREKVANIAAGILGERFEADLNRREKELAAIEKRVERLRSQLKRRISSKDEIIELQVKQITMSWDGLGWEDSSPQRGRAMFMPGVGRGSTTLFSRGGRRGESIGSLVLDAAQRDDEDQLEFLVAKLVEKLKEMEPEAVNSELWQLFEASKDEVASKEYWRALVEAGEEALERYGETARSANTWDTVAHLYEQLGDLEKAIEYQKKAVKLSTSNIHFSPTTNSAQLQEYLKQLEEARETMR